MRYAWGALMVNQFEADNQMVSSLVGRFLSCFAWAAMEVRSAYCANL